MLKKILLGLLVIVMAASMASASVKLGIKDIQANATGVEYVIDAQPVSFTIGGKYVDEDSYIVTGSAIYNPLALGADVTYSKNALAEVTTANLLFRKELVLSKSGLSIVGDVNLVSYTDVDSATSFLTGGVVGLRLVIL